MNMFDTQLTEHFHIDEFWASGCVTNNPEVLSNIKEMSKILQLLRNRVKKPIIITSGYRTPIVNKRVGGVEGSKHLLGNAVDVICYDLPVYVLGTHVKNMMENNEISKVGLGIYVTHIHIDRRDRNVIWRD